MEVEMQILKIWNIAQKTVELRKENGALMALVTDRLSCQQWKLSPSNITYQGWKPVPPLETLKRTLVHTDITLNSCDDSFRLYIHRAGAGGMEPSTDTK